MIANSLLKVSKVAWLFGVGSKVSGKSAIFSPLKIGGGRGFSQILGKLKLKIDMINRKGFKYPIKPK